MATEPERRSRLRRTSSGAILTQRDARLQTDGRPAGGRVQEPPRDEPMGDGFTPHFSKLKFCALAVHFHLYRRGWEPREALCLLPPLAILPTHLRLRGQGACDARSGVTRRWEAQGSSRLAKITTTRIGRAYPALHYTANARQRQAAGRACPALQRYDRTSNYVRSKRSSGRSFAGNVMKYSVATYLGFAITGLALIVEGCCPLRVH